MRKNKKNKKGTIRTIATGKGLKPKVRPARKTATKPKCCSAGKAAAKMYIKKLIFGAVRRLIGQTGRC